MGEDPNIIRSPAIQQGAIREQNKGMVITMVEQFARLFVQTGSLPHEAMQKSVDGVGLSPSFFVFLVNLIPQLLHEFRQQFESIGTQIVIKMAEAKRAAEEIMRLPEPDGILLERLIGQAELLWKKAQSFRRRIGLWILLAVGAALPDSEIIAQVIFDFFRLWDGIGVFSAGMTGITCTGALGLAIDQGFLTKAEDPAAQRRARMWRWAAGSIAVGLGVLRSVSIIGAAGLTLTALIMIIVSSIAIPLFAFFSASAFRRALENDAHYKEALKLLEETQAQVEELMAPESARKRLEARILELFEEGKVLSEKREALVDRAGEKARVHPGIQKQADKETDRISQEEVLKASNSRLIPRPSNSADKASADKALNFPNLQEGGLA